MRENTLHDVCLVMIGPLFYRDATIINKTNCCNLATSNFSSMSCLTFKKNITSFIYVSLNLINSVLLLFLAVGGWTNM